jgi:hypothetical protein
MIDSPMESKSYVKKTAQSLARGRHPTLYFDRPGAGGPVAGTIFFVRVLVRVIVIEQAASSWMCDPG